MCQSKCKRKSKSKCKCTNKNFDEILQTILTNLPVPVSPPSIVSDPDDDDVVPSATTIAQHRAVQTRPISLGTSGGSVRDIIQGQFCCSGTLGSLVTNVVNGVRKQYILSNKHVFAQDVTPGLNNSVAAPGDRIEQAGPVDINCANNPSLYVAQLTTWRNILPYDGTSASINVVDAAIAEVVPGAVKSNGRILGFGLPDPRPIRAVLNMPVRKSARTTGITNGRIVGLNAVVDVEYGVECGSTTTFVARFVNQLVIQSTISSPFSAAGDSGALIVTTANRPRPVGLLFAGNGTVTIANRIVAVLNTFGVTMVGTLPPTATASDIEVDEISPSGIVNVMNKNVNHIMSQPNVFGCYVGITDTGAESIVIMYDRCAKCTCSLPANIEGVPVAVALSDRIRAL